MASRDRSYGVGTVHKSSDISGGVGIVRKARKSGMADASRAITGAQRRKKMADHLKAMRSSGQPKDAAYVQGYTKGMQRRVPAGSPAGGQFKAK